MLLQIHQRQIRQAQPLRQTLAKKRQVKPSKQMQAKQMQAKLKQARLSKGKIKTLAMLLMLHKRLRKGKLQKLKSRLSVMSMRLKVKIRKTMQQRAIISQNLWLMSLTAPSPTRRLTGRPLQHLSQILLSSTELRSLGICPVSSIVQDKMTWPSTRVTPRNTQPKKRHWQTLASRQVKSNLP